MKHLSSFLKSTTFFICSLLILLSLFSYTPKDIAFLTSYSGARIFNLIGVAGAYLGFALFFIFGYASYFFPFALFFMGLDAAGVMRFSGLGKSKAVNLIAAGLFVIFLSGFISLFPKVDTEAFAASGAIGFFLGGFLKKYLGVHGSFITLSLLLAVNAVLFFGFFFVDLLKFIKKIIANFSSFIEDLKNRNSQEISSQDLQGKRKLKATVSALGKKIKNVKPEIKVYTPKLEPNSKKSFNGNGLSDTRSAREAAMQASLNKDKTRNKIDSFDEQNRKDYDPLKYKLPQVSLLKVPPFVDQKDLKEDIEANIKNLETTLSDFGVEARVVSVQKGPVVTMYELQPQSGVKIQRISSLADDIALAMKSSSVRVVAPIPGRGTVGVEIPNAKKQLVFLREVLEEKIFHNSSSKLTLIIGKDVSGNPVIADLADMPHLLIAGATGAGKTVCVNSLISSILFKAKPDEVKFIMVDPKMVELASFAGIPHLIHPIISESKKAFSALNWAVEEMEKRYRALAEAGCRNISLYNAKGKKMPYIIIVVDELADLMIVARESIETSIQRLAQLSRAVGIHLILATQRPSVDVITGVIKANFPARISFKVSSKVDSRTVLDMMGADKLLGKGDLLFLKPGAVKLIRAQGSYIDDEDIESLTSFISVQGKPVYEEAIAEGEKKQALNLGQDDLFDEAVKIILRTNQASASLLQRRLRVGYTRAARLLDLMEQAEIVGPFCGSKARAILVEPEKFLVEKGWV